MNVKHPSSPVTRTTKGRVRAEKPSPSPNALPNASPNPLRGLYWAAYLLIAFAVGRVLNIVPGLSSLPLVKVLLVYIAFALIAHWKVLPKLVTPGNPPAKWWIAFVVWIVLSITYSTWIGASRSFILLQLPVLCTLVLVICKLSGDWESVRNLFLALFVGAVVLVIASLRNYAGGRLDVLGDTNELAYLFDGAMPISMAFGMTAASKKHRLFYYGSVAILALAVVLTGSRGGEFGLLAVLAFIVLAPARLRTREQEATGSAGAPKRRTAVLGRLVLWAAVIALIGMALWPELPQEPRERLASMLSLGSDYNLSDPVGRVQIWKRGLKAFTERPIGYGIATYPMVDWNHGGLFYTAHNSLVLVLVELGPVGVLIYVGLLLHLWGGLAKMRRKLAQLDAPSEEQRQQAVFCRMTQAALIGNFVAGEFLSATYYYDHWTTIALAMALILLFNREKPGSSPEPNRVLYARSVDRGGDVGHRSDQAPDHVRRPRPPRRRRPAGGGPVAGDHRAR